MKHRKSDILWKVVLEDVFGDLLKFIFPDADEVYDLDRGFEYLDKELAELHPQPNEKTDSRFADKLVKVFHRNGTEEWMLLHIEVQGDTDERAAFADRMFTYFYRIRDRYRKPVSAVAIFTGQNGKTMPRLYTYEYRHTRLKYEYLGISVIDYSATELAESRNPFAHVIAAARLRLLEGQLKDAELLNLKLLLAKKLRLAGFEMEKIRAVFIFLRNYILFDDPEMNCKFDHLVKEADKTHVMNTIEYIKMEGKEEGREEGREEGWEEGLKDGRRAATESFVENLIKDTDFTSERIAALTNTSVQFVEIVKAYIQAETK